MKTVLCTLFNFNYLDKGLALIDSLGRVSDDYVLYILAMDDDCYRYLQAKNWERVVPIRLQDYEDERLLAVKGERSFGEYCWTCTSFLIAYVLDHYQEPCCAYIDADMAFYADPALLFGELESRGGTVLLTGHRFAWYERDRERVVGKYCVEFNLFVNCESARRVLGLWMEQCLDRCSSDAASDSFGDQKYLDNWVRDYGFVLETEHPGAGIAPWNIARYRLVSHDSPRFQLRQGDRRAALVFYHFAGIKYLERKRVDIGIYSYWGIDDRFAIPLYREYLQTVDRFKQQVFEETGRLILLQAHPAFEDHAAPRSRVRSILSKLKSRPGRLQLIFKDLPKELLAKKNILSWD